MKYNIKDADGNILNTINSDAEFVEANFDYYELYVEPTPPEPTEQETARQWRDLELSATDYIVPLTDHPQHAAYMTYRQALRDWPSADLFPDTRPELGA
tara:strand:+ start:1149 stop:1445 length:297 start_codon:yes stop_codon:yes gene_type:complete